MKKFIIASALFSVIFTQNLFAEDLRILSINEDNQALIRDADTGDEWLVIEGDNISGWTIISIENNKIVLRKESDEENSETIVKTIGLPNAVLLPPGKSQID